MLPTRAMSDKSPLDGQSGEVMLSNDKALSISLISKRAPKSPVWADFEP